jgi:hypothetical protein
MTSYITKIAGVFKNRSCMKNETVRGRLYLLAAATCFLMCTGLLTNVHLLCYIAALFCTAAVAFLVETLPSSRASQHSVTHEETDHIIISPYFAIVLIFLAAMTAILLPNFLRARASGCLTACNSNLKNIGTACEMYSSDNAGHYPPSLSHLTPGYLKTLPTCPAAGQVTYAYTSHSGPDVYTAWCKGSSHHPVVPRDHPQYDSVSGIRY